MIPTLNTPAIAGAPAAQAVPYFAGTANPRHLRTLEALEQGPVYREALDLLAGASNGPELVAELRRRGLEIPCQRVKLSDLDGLTTRGGRYYLTGRDHEALVRWRGDAKPPRVDSAPGAGLLRLLALVGFAL